MTSTSQVDIIVHHSVRGKFKKPDMPGRNEFGGKRDQVGYAGDLISTVGDDTKFEYPHSMNRNAPQSKKKGKISNSVVKIPPNVALARNGISRNDEAAPLCTKGSKHHVPHTPRVNNTRSLELELRNPPILYIIQSPEQENTSTKKTQSPYTPRLNASKWIAIR
jgi:hypothetical protein